MEEKNIISRNELRESIRKILVGTLLEEEEKVTDNLLDTVIKYYFPKRSDKNKATKESISDYEKEFLENSYLELIGKEKNKIKQEINIDEIKVIVSAFSLSRKSNLMEEYTFEKDLRIFPNIEKIYLFYTKETEYKFENYKKSCSFAEKIIGVEIDGRIVDETYKKLKDLVLKDKINKSNTVLDITLGMKTISIAYYRIAVERQIKAINWNEKFLSNYVETENGYFEENKNGMPPRIALSAKLSLMREPIKESLGIYSRINENIKKGNYEVVSDFYKIIGIDDMAFFYRKLDEIFDLEQEEYDEFYEKLEHKVKELYEYNNFVDKKNEKINEKYKNIMEYLLRLVFYSKNGNFDEMEWFNFQKNEYGLKYFKNEIEENSIQEVIEEFDSKKYFEYLKVKYKVIRTKEVLSDIADNLVDRVDKEYKDGIDNIEEIEDRKKFLKEVKNILFENLIDEEIESFEMEKYLLENNDLSLKYLDGKLWIPTQETYILEINLKEKEKVKTIKLKEKDKNGNETKTRKIKLKKVFDKKDTAEHRPILELLEGINNGIYEVGSNRVEELLRKENTKEVYSPNQKMRELIGFLNEAIKEEMAKNGIEKFNDFIVYSKKNDKNYSIRISEEFII